MARLQKCRTSTNTHNVQGSQRSYDIRPIDGLTTCAHDRVGLRVAPGEKTFRPEGKEIAMDGEETIDSGRGALERFLARLRLAGRSGRFALALACVSQLLFGVASGDGDDDADIVDAGRLHCTSTARAVHRACTKGVRAEHLLARAVCFNVSNAARRAECMEDAAASRDEAQELCRGQLQARREVCALLGEARYDPEFDPASFDDNFTDPPNPNPYIPLKIGNRWEYRGGDQSVTVRVLDRTKLIAGVTCIVVNDVVKEDGKVVEDTDDWFAQNRNGDIHYCGEEVMDFETFEGDIPELPELVAIDGSFKAGRDGDKPGIIFRAFPQMGEVYRQEFSLQNAEDVVEVLSTTYSHGESSQLDRLVPRRLAELLCSGDCVVTRDSSALEPGVFERKYYAPGIGLFLEVNPATGEVLRLVGCNLHPFCARLPQP
jgi:hypothetical protein